MVACQLWTDFALSLQLLVPGHLVSGPILSVPQLPSAPAQRPAWGWSNPKLPGGARKDSCPHGGPGSLPLCPPSQGCRMGTLVQRCSHISVLLRWLTCGRVTVVVTEEKAAPSVCQSPSSPYMQSVFPEKQPSYSLGCVEIAGLLRCPRVSVGLLLGLYVSASGQADTEGGGGFPLVLWPPLQSSGAGVLRGPEPRPLLARRPAFLPLCFILLGPSQGLLCAW